MEDNRSFWRSPAGLAVIFTVAAAVVFANQGFLEVDLKELEGAQLGTLFLTLIFVALVIERAVEVYINNRYELEEMKVRRDVVAAQRRLALHEEEFRRESASPLPPADDPTAAQATEKKAGKLAGLSDRIDEARQALHAAKVEALDKEIGLARRKATAAGAAATVLGAIAAGAGVRILGQFLPRNDDGEIIGPLGGTCASVAERLEAMTDEAARAALLDACETVEFQLGVFRFADILLTALLLAGGADGIHQLVKDFLAKRDDLRRTS